jgi:hypothetical protein
MNKLKHFVVPSRDDSPEAPIEGLKRKDRRVGGRKEEAKKEETSDSLVF